MLALHNGDTSFAADGVLGTNVIETDVSHGGGCRNECNF